MPRSVASYIPPSLQGDIAGRAADSIRRGGEITARGELARGQAMADMVGGLGQIAGQAFGQYAEQKSVSKRDAAAIAAIESWDGQDPNALVASLTMYPPKQRIETARAMVEFRDMVADREGKNLDQNLKRLGTVLGVAEKMPDSILSRFWPSLVQGAAPTLSKIGLDLPPEYAAEFKPEYRQSMSLIGRQLRGEKPPEGFTLGPDQMRFDGSGNVVAQGLPSPEKVPAAGSFEDYVTRMAAEQGKAVGQLTTAEIESARKKYQQADDRPRVTVDVGAGKMQWATDPETGQVRLMTNDEIRQRGAGQPDTAEMRNRKSARSTIKPSIDLIKGLSQKVITEKVSIAQRARAAGRKVESVLGNDPEYVAYQAARFALAGNLAVAQQGSRPSDADILKGWLPLVPDVFEDTQDSSALKWNIIETLSQGGPGPAIEPASGSGGGSTAAEELRKKYGY